jgi:hypothetical protein
VSLFVKWSSIVLRCDESKLLDEGFGYGSKSLVWLDEKLRSICEEEKKRTEINRRTHFITVIFDQMGQEHSVVNPDTNMVTT